MPTAAKKTTARKPAVRKRAVVAKPAPVVHQPPTAPVRTAHVGHRTYIFAVGRRKEAVARVRWHKTGQGGITVNDRTLEHYFPTRELQQLVNAPLVVTNLQQSGSFTAKVAGGGGQGQAEAVRLGIARALVKHDSDLRIPLKRAGYLRRDPRVKERKKYGLKRARRAPQWQKR